MSSASINRTLGAALSVEEMESNSRSKKDPNISAAAAAQWSTACSSIVFSASLAVHVTCVRAHAQLWYNYTRIDDIILQKKNYIGIDRFEVKKDSMLVLM